MSTHVAPAAPDLDLDALVVDEPGRFRVHTRSYTDPGIFALEMDRVFGSTWVYVGHESEIPAPGNYKTAYLGLQPVIVSRTEDGQVHVLFNRCVHRASVVCREPKGTANFFRCPYHGWVYANDGRLKGVSYRRGAYAEDWDKPWGLHRPPRVETYRGLIFASADPDVPTLVEHLGKAKEWIDRQFNLSPVGEIELRYDPHVLDYHGNWKFIVENTVDGYHGNFVHESFWKVQERFGTASGQHGSYVEGTVDQIVKSRARTFNIGCRQGHGLARQPYPETAVDALLDGKFGDHYRTLDERYGRDELLRMLSNTFTMLFPTVAILHSQIRVIRPISVDRTEVTVYPFALKGAPEDLNVARLHGHERFYGPAGFGMPDDVEIFALNQQGLAASTVDWLILDRGLEREEPLESGDLTSDHTDETPQRAIHRAWKRLMAGGPRCPA
jgi:phenylpropionate dioxygenase-like ring-hydroxylating dioxygenase large terminal subunit